MIRRPPRSTLFPTRRSSDLKSTLLNLIGAVDRPTRGRIFLGDEETSALDERQLTMLRRKAISYVFQLSISSRRNVLYRKTTRLHSSHTCISHPVFSFYKNIS